MRDPRRLVGAAALVLATACSSAPVAPRTEIQDGFIGGVRPRTIFVVARDQAAVAESLEQAGLTVTQDAAAAGYVLRVDLGGKRASSGCGTVHNVRYELGYGALDVLEIKARGWTGSCKPNVYEQMSAALASAIPADARP